MGNEIFMHLFGTDLTPFDKCLFSDEILNYQGIELMANIDPASASDKLCISFGIKGSSDDYHSVVDIVKGNNILVRFPFSGFTNSKTGKCMTDELFKTDGTVTISDVCVSDQQTIWNAHISNIYFYNLNSDDKKKNTGLLDPDVKIAADWSQIDSADFRTKNGEVNSCPSSSFGSGLGDISFNSTSNVDQHQLGTSVLNSESQTFLYDSSEFSKWTGVSVYVNIDSFSTSDRLCMAFGIKNSKNVFWSTINVTKGNTVCVFFPFSGFTNNETNEPMTDNLSELDGTVLITDGWTSGQQTVWNIHISNIYYYGANAENKVDNTKTAVDWSRVDGRHIDLWSNFGTVSNNPDSDFFGAGNGDLIYTSDKMEYYINPLSQAAKNILYHVGQCGHFFSKSKFLISGDSYQMYDILYVVNGNGRFGTNSRNYNIKSGDLVFIDTTKPHFSSSEGFMEFYWAHVGGPLCEEISKLIDFNKANVITNADSNLIHDNLIDIILKQRKNIPLSDTEISVKVHILLCEFIKNATENSKSDTDLIINKAISFIRENYKKPLTLETIARFVSLSPFYFSRLFKKNVGYSPHEYLVLTRINAAKILLVTTNMSVKEITFETGFSSDVRFVTVFKNYIGKTPNEFRESNFH